MEVYVLIFEHRHGRDVSAHVSEELAVAEAAAVARERWAEAREHEPSLPESPPEDDTEATKLYFAAREGREFHEIAACPVDGIPAATVGG